MLHKIDLKQALTNGTFYFLLPSGDESQRGFYSGPLSDARDRLKTKFLRKVELNYMKKQGQVNG